MPNTFPDSLIVQYRAAWRKLWKSEPPVIRKAGKASVVIISEHGQSGFVSASVLAGRITDMLFWAREA